MARGSGPRCRPAAASPRSSPPTRRSCRGVRRQGPLRPYPCRGESSCRYSLGEITDGEVLVAHHQSNLALASFAAQFPAKATEHREVAIVLDVGGRCIAMHDNWLVPHQGSASLV